MSTYTIGVDFDGTLVEHRFPRIGEPVPGAFMWCRRFQEAGARLILWTMRSDGPPRDGEYSKVLSEAVDFCAKRGLEFWAVNDNPEQGVWTSSRKVYCHTFIDDANAGCPLVYPRGERPVVCWAVVGPWVMEQIEAHKQGVAA